MDKKGLVLIEVIVIAIIVFLSVTVIINGIMNVKKGNKEEFEFIEYCQSKGNTKEDCKWEWKRMMNDGKSDSIIIMPIPMVMG